MFGWLKRKKSKLPPKEIARAAEAKIRDKYHSFQLILNLNTECLEVISDLQEDLHFIPPRRDVVQERVLAIFERAEKIVAELKSLSGGSFDQLLGILEKQKFEVERYIAAEQELITPRLAVSLSEVGIDEVAEVGGKAAYLAEVGNKLGLPVPNGFVLTTEAYRQFCGLEHWKAIRDAIQSIDVSELETVKEASKRLRGLVMKSPIPRGIEVALGDRSAILGDSEHGLALRSSAVGEGGERTFAGQFLSLINVPVAGVAQAYRTIIAARFSERALSYRVSTGLFEIDSPMAVLVLPVIRATSAGIMYSRDPSNPRSKELWITSTRGLGIDIASGRTPADLYIVSRKRRHEILETHLADKTEEIVTSADHGIERRKLDTQESREGSLTPEQAVLLADYAVKIEKHFGSAQDIEWAADESGKIWILQTRPLALAAASRSRAKNRPKGDPLVSGGRTIYAGHVSGKAYMVEDIPHLRRVPQGSIVFLRRCTPEIVKIFPHISGLVAEAGNVAGHAAALLREFKVPSVFLMKGVFEAVNTGDPVSLDSVRRSVYAGEIWEGREFELPETDFDRGRATDPISENILSLNLLDPSAASFRPSGCQSTHDVLRFCHEKSVEAMFTVNDMEVEIAGHITRPIKSDVPLNIFVLDLGQGIAPEEEEAKEVEPAKIVCLPFRSLWRGVTHPNVSWRRDMPATLGDLASVVASSFTPRSYEMREIGMRSYLLVGPDYMNLNSRLAYHFSLVDACLCEDDIRNYVSFRFAGGGATRNRRGLRASFLEACLDHHGFYVQRRGDLVNAWLRKAPASETDRALDILGRLIACSSQLDMYMTNRATMNWFVEQFIAGNYAFKTEEEQQGAGGPN